MQDPTPPAGGPTLYSRALRLLSSREHSRAELERKLGPHAPDAQSLARVLDTLQAKGFINEQRVLESVLYRRAPLLGAARIQHELQGKGLDPAEVAQAMDQLRSTELARAREVWRKKFGQAPQSGPERAKQMRFLASRGFGGEVIRRVVSGAGDED